jgi:hypothetical protein
MTLGEGWVDGWEMEIRRDHQEPGLTGLFKLHEELEFTPRK